MTRDGCKNATLISSGAALYLPTTTCTPKQKLLHNTSAQLYYSTAVLCG